MIEQFYNDILPLSDAQYVVATLKETKIQHHVVGSRDELIPFLKNYPEYNTYHSLGAYQGLKLGPIHKVNALQGCIGVKAFGFDLDVGEEDPKKYDTLEEAFEHLTQGVQSGKVPEPTWIVYSGGGLQVYWVIEESGQSDSALGGLENGLLEEVVWTSRFQQLRTHLTKYLKIDRTVGTAPYRLLRSPCTANWKYDEPVMPEVMNERRGPSLSLQWLDDNCEEAKPVNKVAANDDVSLSCDQPVSLKQVMKACAAMRQQYDTKGKSTSYPVWIATGNICAHTFEYRKGFHHLSKGHPDYDLHATDDKFQEIVNNASHGPFGCEHFGDPDDPDSPCNGCWAARAGLGNPISATRQLGKKPLPKKLERKEVLDEIAAVEEEDELNPSNNYGIPEHHLPDEMYTDGEWISTDKGTICSHFYVKPLQFNSEKGIGNVLVSMDRETWHSIPAKKMSNASLLAGDLLNVGILVVDDKNTMMYVRHGALMDASTIESSKFGWSEDFDSAFLPTGVIGDVPTEPSADLIKLKQKWGTQAGTLEGWCKAVEIYGRPGQEPYLMALLASLASPLLSYHRLEKGVIMSLTGQGGTGKTTALKAASSVWGAPLPTLSSMSSTVVATRIYLGLCGNLPMILDEITQMDPVDLKQLALEISQGLGRERGTKDAGLAHSERWQLNCLTTSNISVHAKLADLIDVGSADMNRVLELPVVQSEHVSFEQGSDLVQGILDNHGHVGHKFIEHLMTKDIDKERKTFAKMHKALRARDNLQGTDRFVDSLVACCYWAHKRVKEIVPDFPGDPEVQMTWMRQQLKKNDKYIHDILTVKIPDADDFIMEYLQESLILKPMGDKGFPEAGSSLKGYVYDYGEWVVVPKATLDTWCRRQQLKSRTVLDRWGQSGRLKNMGPEDGQFRWTGKMQEPLVVSGKKHRTTVTMIHKGKDYEAGQQGSGNARPNKDGTLPFEANRRRV